MLLVRGGTGEVEWRSDSVGKMLYGRARGSAGACVGVRAPGGARAGAGGRGGGADLAHAPPSNPVDPEASPATESDQSVPPRPPATWVPAGVGVGAGGGEG